MTPEPEALRLAEVLENISPSYLDDEELDTAARLLREQHAEIERLRADAKRLELMYHPCTEVLIQGLLAINTAEARKILADWDQRRAIEDAMFLGVNAAMREGER